MDNPNFPVSTQYASFKKKKIHILSSFERHVKFAITNTYLYTIVLDINFTPPKLFT